MTNNTNIISAFVQYVEGERQNQFEASHQLHLDFDTYSRSSAVQILDLLKAGQQLQSEYLREPLDFSPLRLECTTLQPVVSQQIHNNLKVSIF